MIEKIGDKNVYVQNYTSNFDVKEYIQKVLVPQAFPNIPISKLNLGFTGIVSEVIGQAIEDAYATSALMFNESFITKAMLPTSIYSEAALFNLGYEFAKPSRCNFAIQLKIDDILKHSTRIRNGNTYRYILDKNTRIILGNNIYRFDYDVFIDHQLINNNRIFNIYYDMSSTNSIANITSPFIRYQITSIGWLVLFIDLKEFDRKVKEDIIADNLVTVNSDITLKWSRQIAGMDLVYITPNGQRQEMKCKVQYTSPEQSPFAWYSFVNDNTIKLSFSSSMGYFQPEFNSKIESTIYTCNGASSNFDQYNSMKALTIQKSGDRFEYNINTKMSAFCFSGSTGGRDKGNIEDLRNDVIMAYNTVNVVTTDHDLELWFNQYGRKYNTTSEFFKRRDDPSGRLFSQFMTIKDESYIYPTNTLKIKIRKDQFDSIVYDGNNVKELSIKPGHLWEYADDFDPIDNVTILSKHAVRMVNVDDVNVTINDDTIPPISSVRPFMFTNPFYIKIHRDPTILSFYNYMINHTSWPELITISSDTLYQFQLVTMEIKRSIYDKTKQGYRIQIICVPTIVSNNIKYVNGIGEQFPIENNKLRLILITRSRKHGDTGYIEMKPIEFRNGGAILFETFISIDDNLKPDMSLEVDQANTPGIHSLINYGPDINKVIIDSTDTQFHFVTLFDDDSITPAYIPFDNQTYNGYSVTNKFTNDYRNLTLYKPIGMMRSAVEFYGDSNEFEVECSMIPFLKYDIPYNKERMDYFIRALGDQYTAMEPIMNRLDGNSSLDIKLFNTYGRSSNFYIGPQENTNSLYDSALMLDNIYVNIKFKLAVNDRSIYTQTVRDVKNEINKFFEEITNGNIKEIHISNLIRNIEDNIPNVRYIRFLGFNEYDANKQSIFQKHKSVDELNQIQLMNYVPELIRVDDDSIEISEEI